MTEIVSFKCSTNILFGLLNFQSFKLSTLCYRLVAAGSEVGRANGRGSTRPMLIRLIEIRPIEIRPIEIRPIKVFDSAIYGKLKTKT